VFGDFELDSRHGLQTFVLFEVAGVELTADNVSYVKLMIMKRAYNCALS